MPRKAYRYTFKGEKAFRARVGWRTYDIAFDRFGTDVMRRAAGVFKDSRRRKILDVKAKQEKMTAKLRKIGFDKETIARTVSDIRGWRPPARPQYFPIRKGPARGKYRVQKMGRTTGEIITKKEALRRIGSQGYLKRVIDLRDGLGISHREAQRLYRDVREAARRDLAKLKRTAQFKALPERRKKAYTVKRWERGSLNALAELFDLYFIWG